MRKDLKKKIERFPESPGIYLMKDDRGEVVYVGKSSNLKSRVRSYFRGSEGDASRLICRRMDEIRDIDFVVAGSEKEAFLLEINFIKQFRPRCNVLLRDDKSYVSIKVAMDEPYPRPVITRRTGDKNARYFGPYSNSRAARLTLKMLNDVFPLRKCNLRQYQAASRPCLYGQMGRCLAPCCREVSERVYAELLEEVFMLLEGKSDALIRRMRDEMKESARRMDYETAAACRDRIRAVEETVEKQLASSVMDRVDRDVFGYFSTDKVVWISALFIRDGRMHDAAAYSFPADLDSAEGILISFVKQFYIANRFAPDEILLPVHCDDLNLLAGWLREKRGKKVNIARPQRGRKKQLVELACRNARQALKVHVDEREKRLMEMESLKESLQLEELPFNIECFDISNLGGREAAGSMVVFRDAEPDRGSYRRYRVGEAAGRDDLAMLHEVIQRRYSHVVDKQGPELMQRVPELIVVDGGRGQLDAAGRALDELGIRYGCLVALAKARSAGGEMISCERVFLRGKESPVELDPGSHAFMLLTRIRDEAHRFAVQYHRKLRRKAFLESPLTSVPGVGAKTAQLLLDHFKSLDRIREAGVEELCSVKGVSTARAEKIYLHMKKERK